MVRIASALTFKVIHLFSSAKKNRFVCKLGKNLLLVFVDTLLEVVVVLKKVVDLVVVMKKS